MPKVSSIEKHPQLEEIVNEFNTFPGKSIKQLLVRVNQKVEPQLSYPAFYNWVLTKRRDNEDPTKGTIPTRKEKVQRKEFEQYRDDPVGFAREVLKIELHEGQQRWLRESVKNQGKRTILVPSNRWGKTVVLAVKHIYCCYYKLGMEELPEDLRELLTYETAALSPKLRQVRSMYGYVLQILQGRMWWKDVDGKVQVNRDCQLKDFLVSPTAVPTTNQLSQTPIKFKNGSQIQVGSTGQDLGGGLAGAEFFYMSYDECSLSNYLKEEITTRLMSRLITTNGALDLVGTPDNISDSLLYYQSLVDKGLKGEDGWVTITGMLDDNTFIPEELREKTKERLRQTDPILYRQVVFGEFIKGGSLVFKPQIVKRLWDEKMEVIDDPNLDGGKLIQEPQAGHNYVFGVDWAIANDFTVMVVLDYTDELWKLAYFYRIKGSDKPPQQQFMDLLYLKQRYNNADVMMDTNGLGGKLIESEFRDEPGFHGFNFGPGKKAGFIGTLQKFLYWNSGEGRIRTGYLPELEEELGVYQLNDTKLRQDTVMALGLATWFLDKQEELPEAVDYFG